MFTKKNIEQILQHGFTVEQIEEQLNSFKEGFPLMKLSSSATAQNGITVLSDDAESRYVEVFENSLTSGLQTLKFVPASGAASRMFKTLFEYLDDKVDDNNEYIQFFFDNITKFAFYKSISSESLERKEIVKKLLTKEGLNYEGKPKGLLAFHNYNGKTRTPFEEHLVETASYCSGSDGIAKVHFTVSPEHYNDFQELYNSVKINYQKRFGLKFDVNFSFQEKHTDTIAVDLNNNPITDNNGNLLFRPGGHGALFENLNALNADIIFIKNIDNVVPDKFKHTTNRYKKALAGLLVTIRNKVFSYLEKLDNKVSINDSDLLSKIELFAKKELFINFDISNKTLEEKHAFLYSKLNRPIRICGMVKNEGEPGGGPFWAINNDGTISLQIIEKAQIDFSNKEQEKYFNQSTHFNPVDLICSTKNYKGEKFNLLNYIDKSTGFISQKSKDGITLKALELPGLWNGAMSDWNTIFVEVPIQTFNPVKTINDLLRPVHQQ